MPPTSERAERPTPASLRTAGWLLIVAGVAGVAGFALGWARIVYPSPGPRLTTDAVGHARAGLLLGVFLATSGIVVLATRSREVRQSWASVGIACGVALGGIAVFDLLTERTRAITGLIRNAAQGGRLPGHAAGLVVFSFRPGVYPALAAGGLAVAAAVVLLVGRRSRDTPRASETT